MQKLGKIKCTDNKPEHSAELFQVLCKHLTVVLRLCYAHSISERAPEGHTTGPSNFVLFNNLSGKHL